MRTTPTLFEAEILPHFEQHRQDWLTRARRKAVELGMSGEPITINDVRKECPVPGDIDARVAGAVFANRDTWERLGYVGSQRKVCHGRPVAQFRLKGCEGYGARAEAAARAAASWEEEQ